MLGLVAGVATPLLAEKVGRLATACTRFAVLAMLSMEYHVKRSASTLRKFIHELGEALELHRHEAQLLRLLGLLQQAGRSQGRRKIVLAVGAMGFTCRCETGACIAKERWPR